MFDWFKKPNYSNVVKFPDPKEVPYVQPPKTEEPVTTFYRLGFTSNNRVSLQMGYSEITMNRGGIEHLIQQLQVFRDQIHDEDGDEE
jgi:hypothetical protein